jgi:MtN3 and saliva related transmembrane protein
MAIELIVSGAAALTTAAFLPQALHIIRYKDTRAISLHMYVTFAPVSCYGWCSA